MTHVSHETKKERAFLVHVHFLDKKLQEGDLAELKELALSAGADVADAVTFNRHDSDAKYFIGSGKVAEIALLVQALEIDVVIFDHTLSPSQERNLEKALNCRVLSRTGLILDIFARRAQTFEGKLQVELAQLEYLSTRLVRGWTHLERQKGGIGLRGPGETQLEVDRRLIKGRIKLLKARLEKVKSQRAVGRRSRQKSGMPVMALVGYTNAGKSTLFNRMSGGDAYVANQLFATLDPKMHQVMVPGFGDIVIIDTVGFIRHLPHTLVEAFHATLEETLEADLLLHVMDASHPEKEEQETQVLNVLQEIGAGAQPMLKVYNKIDLLTAREAKIDYDEAHVPSRVYLSAQTGEGLPLLYQAIQERLSTHMFHGEVELASGNGKLRAKLYALNAVRSEKMNEAGQVLLEVSIDRRELDKILDKA